jgi:hypothetical protein
MAFGLIDTSHIDWPSNVDNTYLRGLETRSGLRFTDLARRLDAGLAQVNAGVDPIMSLFLTPPTTNAAAQGGRTSRMVATKRSEYTLARPQYVERRANMLPIDEYEIALGFTEDGLMEITLDDFQAQVDGLVAGWEMLHRAEVLSRLFSDAEIPVDGGKTTATSPGFAGSGTGANVFAGLYPDNTALPGGYSHYYRDTTANFLATVKAQRDRLKRWHPGPFDFIGSEARVAALVADTTAFVSAGSALIRVGDGVSEALVDADRYIGVYDKDIRVHIGILDFATDHWSVFKTYGPLSPRNALTWRYDPLRGIDAYVRSRELFPLAEAVSIQKFGVGVNDRTAATLGYAAASGVYTAPTLTY